MGDIFDDGEAVLLFYRGRFCPTCPPRSDDLEEYYVRLRALGIPVVTVHVEEPTEEERALLQRTDLEFGPSDLGDSIAAAGERPMMFVLSPQGDVLWQSAVDEGGRIPDAEEMIEEVVNQRQPR